MAFGAVRSIWTALVRRKAERSLLYGKPRSSLDIDDGAGNTSLAEGEFAGVAESKQGASCITLRIARALNEELAVEDHGIAASVLMKSGFHRLRLLVDSQGFFL